MAKKKKDPSRKLLSVCVPVLNEEENIDRFYAALIPVLKSLQDRFRYEVIFTDNHSTDGTYEKLRLLAEKDKNVRVIRFSRNFGFQRSIYTAYSHACGDAAVQIDCDLQDPPQIIPQFVKRWEAGYQVVYGIRRSRKEFWLLSSIRRFFYFLIDLLSEDNLPRHAGDFRLIDRRVIEELQKMDDQQPYLRGAIAGMGFEQTGIPYDRARRTHGKSKFTLTKLIRLGLDGILNHSIIPLRIATFTGIVISAVTFLGSLGYMAGKYIFGQAWPAGFATTTVLILTSLSLNALFLGIIGEYLGRIYQQVKKRPLTIIEKEINTRSSR